MAHHPVTSPLPEPFATVQSWMKVTPPLAAANAPSSQPSPAKGGGEGEGVKVPPGIWRILTVLAALLVAAVLTACGGDEPTGTRARGRSLEIHLSDPVVAQKMTYKAGAEERIVQAGASNRQLVMVKVTVVNRTSTVVLLDVDGDVAQIGDRRGQRIGALDPQKEYKLLDAPDPSAASGFVPFLWGEIELPIDLQVEGWMVFEVPVGLRLGSFWWDEVDYIILDYPA